MRSGIRGSLLAAACVVALGTASRAGQGTQGKTPPPAHEAPKEEGNMERAQPGAIPAPSDVASPPADAERTASGLASKVIQAGTGDKRPSARDTVKVHYT